ncbi:hypothetical protein KFK09_006756 [Dendrobium nobile]|uniref:Saposin B-type domain-containing protein n=1 Tax=Dendrobium nobile TaxID=94219 RepID=A0A8T3BVB7_DENNO|nr:hypothetical protein KFK09_006756 [Dendrobium nobile]
MLCSFRELNIEDIGIMDLKEGIFLLVLLISSKSAYASTDLTGENPITEGKGGEPEQLCTVCEVFTARATTFLNENKTRSEILDTLHHACSELRSLELKCLILVDYYSTLFFSSIGKIRPEEFCGRVGLCDASSVSMAKNDEKCALCHRVVVGVLLKIKNPDAQLEILQMLFKKCDKMKNYAHECKWLVMHYGPYMLTKGEKFLETNDVCASIHACSSKQGESTIGGAALPGSSIHDT